MSNNRFGTIAKAAGVVAIILGVLWIDAAPQKEWYGKLVKEAHRKGLRPIPGTEIKTIELYNPFLWSGVVKQVWMMQDAGVTPKTINSIPTVYSIRVMNYEGREQRLAWMLSTRGRWSVAEQIDTDREATECWEILRKEGDKFFKGRLEDNHEIVLAYIKSLARDY